MSRLLNNKKLLSGIRSITILNLKSIINNLSFVFSLSLILFISSGKIVKAQSLDSLVVEGLLNNPQLKAIEYSVKSKEKRVEAAGYLPPPALGIEFNQIPTGKYDLWNDPLSQNISLTQMIPLGGKLSAMQEVERKNKLIAISDYDIYRTKLIGDIQLQYYKFEFLYEKLRIMKKNLNLLNDTRVSAVKMYEVNRLPKSELFMIESEIASLQTDIELMLNEIEAEYIQMNNLLGRDLNNSDFDFSFQKDELKLIDIDGLSDRISLNPDLQKMRNMIAMNEAELSVNDSELIPDLMIGGMFMRMPRGMILTTNSDPDMHNGTGYMYGIMASVTLPFMPWSAGKFSSQNESLIAEIKGIEKSSSDMERKMLSEYYTMRKMGENYLKEINLYNDNVIPLLNSTYMTQVTEFQNNQLRLTSIFDTLRMILMKEEKKAEALNNFRKSNINIEALFGYKNKYLSASDNY